MNPITNILNIGGQTIGLDSFYEVRIENDANGNPVFVGKSPRPNALTSDTVWFIFKLFYDGNQALTRVQQPDSGEAFIYSWDDRATYF